MNWRTFGCLFAGCIVVLSISAPAKAEIVELLVPSRIIQTGERVGAADVAFKTFEVSKAGAANYVTDAAQLQGRQSRRILQAGRPIANSSLGPVLLVRRSQVAEGHYRAKGIIIAMPLTVLEDGSAGSVILARNASTGKKVRVRVEADGTLDVLK